MRPPFFVLGAFFKNVSSGAMPSPIPSRLREGRAKGH